MFPWLWIWAPRLPFADFSIAPATDWSFGNISPDAGDGRIEKQVHEEVASYGRQIGLLTEVLLPLAGDTTVSPKKQQESLARLKEIRADVETLKGIRKRKRVDTAAEALEKLAEEDPEACKRLLQRVAASLVKKPALPAPRS